MQGFSSLERGYDLLAPKFDLTPFRTPDEVIAATVEQLGPIRRAVDLCCGTGAGVAGLRPHCAEAVVGVDLSAGMLEQARANLSAEGVPVEWLRADVLDLPFVEAFDAATCFGALGHIAREDEDAFLQSVARALRPGGRFAFVTTERLSASDPAWWVAHAFNAGWRLRNALFRPRFIMYYLNFTVPQVNRQLERHGFEVQVRRGVFGPHQPRLVLVIAIRRG